jgi:hypothetical protein
MSVTLSAGGRSAEGSPSVTSADMDVSGES